MMGGLQTARLEALRRNTTIAFELTDLNSTAWHVCLFDLDGAAAFPATSPPAIRADRRTRASGVEYRFRTSRRRSTRATTSRRWWRSTRSGACRRLARSTSPGIDVRNPSLEDHDERRLSIQIHGRRARSACATRASQQVREPPGLPMRGNPMNDARNPLVLQQGVMLIEALVAILIFTLGIVAVMGLQANSIAQMSEAKYRTDASYLASQIMGHDLGRPGPGPPAPGRTCPTGRRRASGTPGLGGAGRRHAAPGTRQQQGHASPARSRPWSRPSDQVEAARGPDHAPLHHRRRKLNRS